MYNHDILVRNVMGGDSLSIKFASTGSSDNEPFITKEQEKRMMEAEFYTHKNNIEEGGDGVSMNAKKIACQVSDFVVGVSCKTPEYFGPNLCSGIIIDWDEGEKVLTSSYVLGDHAGDVNFPFPINVHLSHDKGVVPGTLLFVDKVYNLAIIHALSPEKLPSVPLAAKSPKLDQTVVAVGRFCRFNQHRLVASYGTIIGRKDRLDCDDLLASSCPTNEWGIGGPLVDTSGDIIGMNFYGGRSPTPFVPSSLLLMCLDHFKNFGEVLRPAVGIRTRSLLELPLDELEAVQCKFLTLDSLYVKEVYTPSDLNIEVKVGSAADNAGLCVGDVIIYCNGTKVTNPFQLALQLFRGNLTRKRKQGTNDSPIVAPTTVELTIHCKNSGEEETKRLVVESSTASADDNSWWSVRRV